MVGRTNMHMCTCSSSIGMLALLRNLSPELSRGISTALALLAVPKCPTSQCSCSPHFVCEPLRCPDCVCNGSNRACPDPLPTGAPWLVFLIGCITCLLLGYTCGRIRARAPASAPETFVAAAPAVEDQTQLARNQLAEIRSRRNGLGSR